MQITQMPSYIESAVSHTNKVKTSTMIKKNQNKSENTGKFENVLRQTAVVDQKDRYKIEEYVSSTEKAKQTLMEDITEDNLNKYKEVVSQFINYYVKNYIKLEYFYSKDPKKYGKKMQTIKTIKGNVEKLVKTMIKEHQENLKMLKKIDQIQGLIVDLLV